MRSTDPQGPRFTELHEWQRWQDAQQPLHRRIRRRFERGRNSHVALWLSEWGIPGRPRVVVGLDSSSPSQIAALISPARRLASTYSLVVVAPFDAAERLGKEWPNGSSRPLGESEMPEAQVVLSTGDHLHVGNLTRGWALVQRIPYVVVQHGVLTTFAPPLPDGCHLLSWTEEDHNYWAWDSSRVKGITTGSQLLWEAHQGSESDRVSTNSDRVVFLGQLHGAELARTRTRRTLATLAQSGTQVVYRPHPGEVDALSRVQHRIWQRRGLTVDRTGELTDIACPVVAHFSTGILEAAAAGLASYAFCVEPPPWLLELWDRYGMARWGSETSTVVSLPNLEPSEAVARYVHQLLKGEVSSGN